MCAMMLVAGTHTHRRCLWGDREVGGGREREDKRGMEREITTEKNYRVIA